MLYQWVVLHQTGLKYMGILSVLALIFTPMIISALVILMPEDYFLSERDHILEFSEGYHPLIRTGILVTKNAAGIVFILAGLVMLVLPGQGILTILIGLTLVNFPGKRSLERRIIRQEKVCSAINWMRSRAGRPPLKISGDEGE